MTAIFNGNLAGANLNTLTGATAGTDGRELKCSN